MLDRLTQDMDSFRTEANLKLSKQQDVLIELMKKKSEVELESKELLLQLGEERKLLLEKTKYMLDEAEEQERKLSSELILETGILTRKLASNHNAIELARSKVAMMLDQTAKTKAKVRNRNMFAMPN